MLPFCDRVASVPRKDVGQSGLAVFCERAWDFEQEQSRAGPLHRGGFLIFDQSGFKRVIFLPGRFRPFVESLLRLNGVLPSPQVLLGSALALNTWRSGGNLSFSPSPQGGHDVPRSFPESNKNGIAAAMWI